MATLVGSAWEFKQLGPPNKAITLNAYQAPFGRLRKSPVMDTEFELRVGETFYGGLRVPTRQHFGDKESAIAVHGRWSDKYLGANGANDLVDTVKQFIADAVQCTVSWGQIVAYKGLPHKLRIGREDGQNVTWEISVLVDEDVHLSKVVPKIDGIAQSPQGQVGDLSADLGEFMLVDPGPLLPDLSPPFLDQLALLTNALRNAIGEVYAATNVLQDWVSSTNEQLSRVAGAVTMLTSIVSNLQDVVNTTALDGILYYRTAETDFAWANYVASSDHAAENVIFDCARIRRQVQLAQQGQAQVTTRAQAGDTWETISDRVYGQPDGANTLRSANGVQYGQQPTPGQSYVVPLTATDL